MRETREKEATVLVIDDEESTCDSCQQALERRGYRAGAAQDGEEGLRLVEELRQFYDGDVVSSRDCDIF